MKEKKYIKLTPFKMQVLQSFPFIDADFDALTNYELLCKVVEYLNITIDNVNLLNDDFKVLYDYVHDYFKNLDVQEEINNKLDDMAESGELTDIIAQYLGLAGVLAFDTVSDMKNATNLVNGSICKTLGYHTLNDGGMATYKIRTVTNEDTVDEMFIIALNDETLVAELIIENEINVKQFGAYGDGTHDDTSIIQNALDSDYNVYLPEGTYIISDTLIMPFNKILKGQNKFKSIIKSTIENDYTIQYGESYDYNGLGGRIEDITITSENDISNKPFGIYAYSSITLKHIRFYTIGKVFDRINNYIDNILLDDVYIGYCVPNGDYIFKNAGNNDGLNINQLKISKYLGDTTEYNSIMINKCHGGNINNSIIGMGINIENCNAFSITNSHLENTDTSINLKDSEVSLKNMLIYKNSAVNDITILNSDTDVSTNIILENVMFYITGAIYNDYTVFAEEINTLPYNSTLQIKNCFRQFNFGDRNRSSFNTYGILIKGLSEFNYHSSNYSLLSTIITKTVEPTIIIGNVDNTYAVSSTSLGSASTSAISTWNISDQAVMKYRAVIVVDEQRKLSIGRSNEASIADLQEDGDCGIIITNEVFGKNIMLFSGGASNQYTRKCFIPCINRGLLVDNGLNINGYPVETITSTNGTSLYTQITKYIKNGDNVIVYHTTTPSLGIWKKFDKIINTNITSGQVISWIYDGENWIAEGIYS